MLFASLTVVLFAFWLVLSGHYTAITVLGGVGAAVLVAYVARRMDAVDREGHPIHLLPRALPYYCWLAVEIVKSGWQVAWIIVHPRMPISPTLAVVHGSQKSAPGLVTYANSITLTPGTLSARVVRNDILVHALTREGAESLFDGDMDRRVARMEGGA